MTASLAFPGVFHDCSQYRHHFFTFLNQLRQTLGLEQLVVLNASQPEPGLPCLPQRDAHPIRKVVLGCHRLSFLDVRSDAAAAPRQLPVCTGHRTLPSARVCHAAPSSRLTSDLYPPSSAIILHSPFSIPLARTARISENAPVATALREPNRRPRSPPPSSRGPSAR